MKKYRLVLAGVFVVASMARGLWAQDQAQPPATKSASESEMQVNPVGVYQEAQKEAFRAHPEMETEYKDIVAKIDKQRDEEDAAMIKVDPSLEPFITRVALGRKRQTAEIEGTPPPAGDSVPALPADFKITPDFAQKFRTARETADKANPALLTSATELSKRTIDFNRRLDAVIIEEHPSYAPMIAAMRAPKAPPASAEAESH